MANRSYLYTCDDVPGGKRFRARGLSECAWDIPLVYRLMVATEPQIVRSAIWPLDIAILARRDGAFERALAFLDKLGAGKLVKRQAFDRALAAMKAFLAAAPPSRYILLEPGEIFDAMDTDPAELIGVLSAQIPLLASIAARAVAGGELKWLAGLRKHWQESANPGAWTEALNVDLATPAKKPAAKKPAAKKSAAKKPAAKKPAAKKPAAKKPAAKKSAAKKPAAKKPATKKPAAKKSAARR